jgi:tryptophan synthase alpha subunit
MQNKIDDKLTELRIAGRTGLMTHVVIGYPTLEKTVQLVKTMEQAGVDFVELQIPFSDPLADGPTIQRACERALAAGTKVSDAFAIAKKLSAEVRIPLLFMAYFNTVYKYGIERFCADARAAGISGLIVPDAPLEAAQHEAYLQSCSSHNLHNIITLAPTSTDDRLAKNASIASGFVYCMSRQGVTGTHLGIDPAMQSYLDRVRQHITVPLAVGFGIANRKRLEIVVPYCDIAVVGSAILDVIDDSKPETILTDVKKFLRSLMPALKR